MPHLFPRLERTLRETEFRVSQDERGHQTFRTALPIRPSTHDFHAAADGQLGGIMKVYREWRISGDTEWLRALWPKVKHEPRLLHRDLGPAPQGRRSRSRTTTPTTSSSGARTACARASTSARCRPRSLMGAGARRRRAALRGAAATRAARVLESELFNGEYFIQKIAVEGPAREEPAGDARASVGELLARGRRAAREGRAQVPVRHRLPLRRRARRLDGRGLRRRARSSTATRSTSHLAGGPPATTSSSDLSEHANPQRPGYACGDEGGLLLCTWPQGRRARRCRSSTRNEVWTGIEYQVASHLMLMGLVDEGLEIVRVCRDRYDGRVRNPFNEYECGHWYARAMSSYAPAAGPDRRALRRGRRRRSYLEPRITGDFRSFLVDGHRLRHRRRARRQAVRRGRLGHDRRPEDRLPAARVKALYSTGPAALS